ncbi:MAG TPA: polysaccharide biosynthesis/export family protein [Novosphingobium sp.]|nr:polysaccharide biosynthesis/export family protein [Novosphingobium sp.]
MHKFGIALTGLAMLLAGCATYDSNEIVSTGERFETYSGTEQYQLGVGDGIQIRIYNEDGLSGEFMVQADGTISLPLIGKVTAVGTTPNELGAELERRYAEGYLRMPNVRVQVRQYRPVYVLGEVSKAGQYPYVPGMTAMSAIATASGYSPRANRKVILIKGANSEAELPYRVTPELRIFPGDTIRVDERFF